MLNLYQQCVDILSIIIKKMIEPTKKNNLDLIRAYKFKTGAIHNFYVETRQVRYALLKCTSLCSGITHLQLLIWDGALHDIEQDNIQQMYFLLFIDDLS